MTACSPRTRGWSLTPCRRARRDRGAPRARGDGPARSTPAPSGDCSPRTRGWSRSGRREPGRRAAPRARGDGPSATCSRRREHLVLPAHAGMVPATPTIRRPMRLVLPAHAGMVPCRDRSPRLRRSAPRARGDGPRRRGPSSAYRVLPAHAGMVPARHGARARGLRAPREHGGSVSSSASSDSLGWGVRHEGLGRGPSTGPFARRHINVTGTCSFRDERR